MVDVSYSPEQQQPTTMQQDDFSKLKDKQAPFCGSDCRRHRLKPSIL